MPRRREEAFPDTGSESQRFERTQFEDEQHDAAVYIRVDFQFCTFIKIGLRNSTFKQCTFRHCEFIDCYLVGATFEHCNFIGSTFRSCNFTWADFPNSQLDYTKYSDCAPILLQVEKQKPKDPQAAAKFFRNLALEHRASGNWQEVDRLIHQSYRERERHFWFAITGQNAHYKDRYGGFRRVRYGVRYVLSRISGVVWGYGVSWLAFGRSLFLLVALVLPLLNGIVGTVQHRPAYFWPGNPLQDILHYIELVYRTSVEAFFPFVPSSLLPQATDLALPFWLVIAEATAGTIFVGLFISLLFRASSKGA